MKTDRELLEHALEALWEANTILVCSNESYKDSGIHEKNIATRQAINARLAEDDEEPVYTGVGDDGELIHWYRRPAPARKPLTDEEIVELIRNSKALEPNGILPKTFIREIEKAHGIGEKTNG